MILGIVIGSPLGGYLYQRFIDFPIKSGLSPRPQFIWLILGLGGVFSIIGIILSPAFRELDRCAVPGAIVSAVAP